jgi:class 3 adenylate cyclase/tetratricopeptide (TPR) repeat protein
MAACPRCGEENPERARFCLACGRSLQAEIARGEERKVVSILFADLIGFTASSDRADPEDVGARLRPYYRRLKQEIESFGGTVEKFVGDAVMAAFGAPVAHEDDAERAVRAGLRILEAIDELNEEDPGLELSIRAAVNTGEAIVAVGERPPEGEGFVTGDVVNTAARLQQAAPAGAVVVGEQTFQTTKQVIEYQRLAPVSVRGKPEPLPLWLAQRPRTALGGAVEPEISVPFVGREHELALLGEMYARTDRDLSVQLVTLTGEPGVGKSRLIAEFRALVDAAGGAVAWRRGRCLPYGAGVTFWALGQIVKAQAGILESDTADVAGAKLHDAVAAVIDEPSERDWFEARLGSLIGTGTAEAASAVERSESFTAWRRFLEAIATKQPLVLVIEDLHWADEALLDFVEHLADWSSGVPILVVCTARPELYERRPAWGGGKYNSTTAALSPLTTDETARLIGALLSQAVLPVETQAVLLERAGGNPLYAQEFVHMLRDRGVLEQRGRVLEVARGAEIAVPETIEALIAARLDTLPPARKSLLQAAAVIGKDFWQGALVFVAGAEEREVEDALHELARKELVRRARTSSVLGENEFAFWHALVRDVAYRQIPRAARIASHRAAAEWIERIAGERVTDHAELLAHHYGHALELARAAGAETDGLEERTRRFLVLAGERALPLDVGKAESFFRQALELLRRGDPAWAKVVARTAETAALAGRYADAEAAYAEAIEEFRAEHDDRAAGTALIKLGQIVRDKGEAVRARSLLGEAVELLERAPRGPELVLAYTHTARYHHFHGPAEECFEWAEKATRTAEELGIEGQAVRAVVWREWTRFARGEPGALEKLKGALRLALDLGLAEDSAAVYLGLGDVVWWAEGPAAGLATYREGIEFTERRGMRYYTTYLKAESVWPLFELGRWNELLDVAGEVVEWDRTSYQALLALPYAAHVRLVRGEVAEAAELRDDFLPRARESGDWQVLVPALATSALIDQSRGDLPAAVRMVEELGQATRGRAVWRAQRLPDLTRVCAAAGATRLGESLLEDVHVTAARQLHAVHAARAILAEARGELEQARSLYEEVVQRWAEFGFGLERAFALLGHGRCLLALHEPARAEPTLQQARDELESLGAGRLVAEAESLLERSRAVAS